MNQASEWKKTSNRIKEMLKMSRQGGGGMQAKNVEMAITEIL